MFKFPLKYLLIKIDNNDDFHLLLDFLYYLIGHNLNVSNLDKDIYLIVHNYLEEINLAEAVNSFSVDSYIKFQLFSSDIIKTQEEFEEYHHFLILFKSTHLSQVYYDRKMLISASIEKENGILLKELILKKYVNDQQMLDIIKTFFRCNLNVSQSAEQLFLHRNTLINKLERFFDITGFDLRIFSDAVIINQILKY